MSMSKGIKQFGKNVGQSSTELMSTYIKDGFTLDQAKRATDIAMAHKIEHYVDEHFNDKSAAEITSSLSGFGKED